MSWSRNPRRRDMRPINDPATQAGVRGAQRDMRGNLSGGYMPQADGSMKAFGSKEPGSGGGSLGGGGIGSTSGRLGGGLSRWESMNPNAKKAFSAGSPANSKSANRAMSRPAVGSPPVAAAPASNFVQAMMPRPAVPSPMPVPGRPAAPPASPVEVANRDFPIGGGGALRRPARKIGPPQPAGGDPGKMGPEQFAAAERGGYIKQDATTGPVADAKRYIDNPRIRRGQDGRETLLR